MADSFTITQMEKTSEGYSIWEVTRKVIREHYYSNNQDVAETLINGDRTAYNRLVVRIRELNNLANGAQYVSSNKSTILIPTLDEFQELMLPLSLHNTQAILEVEPARQYRGAIMLFRGHSAANRPAPNEVPIIINVFNLMKDELIKRDYEIIIDPQQNYPNGNFGITARQAWIKERENQTDIFIEIHANARQRRENGRRVDDPNVSGCETYYPQTRMENPRSVFLAESIVNAINREMPRKATAKEDSLSGPESLGVLGGRKASIKHNVPSIVFETGYLTNPQEFALMRDRSYLSRLVILTCNGIDAYFSRYPTRVFL